MHRPSDKYVAGSELAVFGELGAGHVLVAGPVHHRRDQPQHRPRLLQMGVEHFQEPRPGVLRHSHGVAEGHAGGGDAVVAEPAQPF